jgi:hypothetical protein
MIADRPGLEDALVEGLRTVLRLPDDRWQQNLDELMGEQPDPLTVRGMREFLSSRLGQAGKADAGRMRDMIAVLDVRLANEAKNQEAVERLLSRIADLQDEARRVDATLQAAKDTLVQMIGYRTKRRLSQFRFSIGRPLHSVRVIDRDRVADAYRSLQVDRRLILNHFRSTGEVPTGVEIRETRPSVIVKRLSPA